MPNSLKELRHEIDRCNLDLLSLLNRRAELALKAGRLKASQTNDLFDGARQAEMFSELVTANQGPLSGNAVVSVFGAVFGEILDLMASGKQAELKVHRIEGEPDRVFEIAGHTLGAGPTYIAGPCAVESETQLDAVAKVLHAEGVGFLRGGAFKPRTSPYSFQGLGLEGLKILREVSHRYGMASVTEVTDPRNVDLVCEYADLLQVGTRNMANYELLREVAQAKKPVLFKRGYMASLDEYLLAAEYIFEGGNDQVILCERGIRTFVRHTRFTLDLSAVPILQARTGLPVVVDVSHAAGRTDILQPLVLAAFSVGANAVMLEVHPNPPAARSDPAQQLTPDEFVALKRSVGTLAQDLVPAG